MAEQRTSGVAIGFSIFAAVMMWWIGAFHAIDGLVAIFNDKVFATTPNYIFQFDLTTWGWIHLVLGIVTFLAAFGVIAGAVWGRVVGIGLAVVSAIANFAFIPYYPVWSMLIIAVDVVLIWALSVHGRDIAS
jgi:hypothetical protein